jgi:hypothetical protein
MVTLQIQLFILHYAELINYELAWKNILFNNFSHKISAVLAGYSKNSGEINIDPSYRNGAFSTLKEFKVGINVPYLLCKIS